MAQSVQTSIHELEKLSDEQVGAHFKEYLRENEHAGWEGFEDEMDAIQALLQDFSTSVRAQETDAQTIARLEQACRNLAATNQRQQAELEILKARDNEDNAGR